MSEAAVPKKIEDDIRAIKEDISYIKDHMFDPDTVMTKEESKRFEQSMKEFKEGKSTPLSKLKKEIGL